METSTRYRSSEPAVSGDGPAASAPAPSGGRPPPPPPPPPVTGAGGGGAGAGAGGGAGAGCGGASAKETVAGVGSRLPTESVARTESVCSPGASEVYDTGEVQNA